MKFNLSKKSLVFIIIILLVGTNIISGIDGFKNIKNKKLDLNFFDPIIYQSIPNWISDNPHYSTGAALSDINKDGWLDIIISDGNDMMQGRLNLYLNNGNGSFPTMVSWQSNDLAYNGHIDISDVNGDGWPDVAVSYLGTGSSFGPIARLYLNNNGVLSSLPDWNADIIGNAFGVDFGDMNNDGRPDLAVATGWAYDNYKYHKYVYLNVDGELEPSASWVSDDMNIHQAVLWLDADDDGWLDLAFIGTNQNTKIYRNLGGILETTASWYTSDSPYQDGIMLSAGDINSDGLLDLFTTDNIQLGASGEFRQYHGLSEGMFETTNSWNYNEGYCSAVALADVNGDNKLDLATGAWWDNTRIFLNQGFGLPSNPSWSSGFTSVIEKIVFGNVGPTNNKYTYVDIFDSIDNCKLFYLSHNQIQEILSVYVDDILLDFSEYTYSREHGWISVDYAPINNIKVTYNYSRSLDMVISNWDPSIGNYLYYNQLLFSDIDCDDNLLYSDIQPAEKVINTINISNVGDFGSDLDWEIESYPSWGTWSFDPEFGMGLKPEDGEFSINIELISPGKGSTLFNGEIKIVNKNDFDDFCIIEVSLLTAAGPDLNCNGNLIWSNVKPGDTVKGSFSVSNIGENVSSLDWSIEFYPKWGNWSFSSQNGDNLKTEDGPFIVYVDVIAPTMKKTKFSDKLRVININNPDDFCELEISLITSKILSLNKVCNVFSIFEKFNILYKFFNII